jgi:FHIPEP family protein
VEDVSVLSGQVAVKINALLGTPMARIPANVPTVASTSEIPRLRDARDLPGRWPQALDPSIFMGRRRRRDTEAGSPPSVGDVVIPALNWAVEAAPERLMGLSDTEHLIAKFEGGFPDLVRAALKQFSLLDLTMVLRGLARERVCIRDLRTILEALLEYEWVGVDTGERLVFDERVVLPKDIAPDVAEDLAFRVEAPRRALVERRLGRR